MQKPRTHVDCARGEKHCGAELRARSVHVDAPQLYLRPKRQRFNVARVILPMIDLTSLPLPEHSISHMLSARFSSSVRGGDEARGRVLRVGRDVGWVVGVDLDGPDAGLLEVDEEAGDEYCRYAVG